MNRIRLKAVSARRKWAARLLAGAIVTTAVVIVLAYRFASTRREQPLTVPQNLPADVNQQLSGSTFTRSNRGREVFTIHAARTLNLKRGGPVVLEDVAVEIFGQRSDRRDLLRTQHARYDPQSGDFVTEGQVEMELNSAPGPNSGKDLTGTRSVYLKTSNVSSHDRGAILSTDDPVTFQVGPASGSARGLEYAPKDIWLELKKDVHAEFQPGPAMPPIRLTGTRLRYEKQTGQVVLWGPVEVQQGSRRMLAGRGQVSLSARNRVVQVSLENHVQAFGALEADSATQRGPHSPGPETSLSAQQTLLTSTADRVRQEFEPETGELRRLVAEGAVKVESRRFVAETGDPGKARSSYGSLSAQRLEIFFRGSPAQPQRGIASGNVEVRTESGSSPGDLNPKNTRAPARPASGVKGSALEARVLKASEMRFSFYPGGRSLERLETPGTGELTFVPADTRSSRRTMTAGQLLMTFDASNRPERVMGLNGTRVISDVPVSDKSGTTKGETSADRLEATFDPATGNLKTFDQSGNFRFTSGNREARADEAQYTAQGQTTTLTGHPEVWDPVSRIRADRILLRLDTDAAEGSGHVQSSHVDQTGPERQQGVLKPLSVEPNWKEDRDQHSRGHHTTDRENIAFAATTNVLADHVVKRRREEFVHYEGHVRAWHGPEVIESSWLDYYGKEHRLTAGSPVFTYYLGGEGNGAPRPQHVAGVARRPAASARIPANASVAMPRAPAPLTVRADSLEILQDARSARYTGNIRVQTADTTLTAGRADVYLSAAGRSQEQQIERATADGHVLVTQPGRRAWGDHAEYIAAEEKITMSGGKPTFEDEQRGSTTGESLTFSIRDDRLWVDGGEKSPTFSNYRVTQ